MCTFFVLQTFTFVDAIIITVEVAAFTSIFHPKDTIFTKAFALLLRTFSALLLFS